MRKSQLMKENDELKAQLLEIKAIELKRIKEKRANEPLKTYEVFLTNRLEEPHQIVYCNYLDTYEGLRFFTWGGDLIAYFPNTWSVKQLIPDCK